MKLKTTATKKSGHGGHIDGRRRHWERLFRSASGENEATWDEGYKHISFCKEARDPLCPEFIFLEGETVVGYSNVLVLVLIEL